MAFNGKYNATWHIHDMGIFSTFEKAQQYAKDCLWSEGWTIEFDWEGCKWHQTDMRWYAFNFEILETDMDKVYEAKVKA